MTSLAGKVALVTGASRGIGEAVAMELAQQGAIVVGTATSQERAEAITAAISGKGLLGQGLVLNVTDPVSIEAALASIQSTFGLPSILVNNAGIALDNLLLRMSDEEWIKVIDTNLGSIYRLSKACLRGMVKARWGRIINISSVVASMGSAGQTNYAAAKAGIIGFSKSLAQEVASRSITVNVVAPGFIETDMTRALGEDQRHAILNKIPMGEIGAPENVATAVAFLASPAASYITGVTLHVNGGMYMA